MADAGRDALGQLKAVLAQRPATDGELLSSATVDLGRFREQLITSSDRLEMTGGENLSHLNAIISVVMAMHFPLGTPPWDEFEKALGWLADLVERVQPRAA